MPSVEAAFSDFFKAITAIVSALINSVLSVFHAFFALGQEVLGSVLHLFHALFSLVTDLTSSMVGFVIANFFAIVLIGGVAYWYTQRSPGTTTRSGKKRA
ncbi:hypothetical protein BXZ70DRAFT_155942 [Cristinia sonorae]|uniref:Uncharacterized protein n=1 Tax=Cristinia sonorae TaxID=1940300 RepID=A0A8K0UQK4_9AGAR|nr:hypothetical protein BXZ70DRAFT_155942 [Cristinia sonorae]